MADSVRSSDAPCGQCDKLVSQGDKALECDICSSWFHLGCSKASSKCYESILRCEGLPWICDCCKSLLRGVTKRYQLLEQENTALRVQIDEILKELSLLKRSLVPTSSNPVSPSHLSGTSEPSLSPARPRSAPPSGTGTESLPLGQPVQHLPLPMPSPPVTCLNTPSSDVGDVTDPPSNLTPPSHGHTSQNAEQSSQIRYIRKIDSSLSVEEITTRLASANLKIDDSVIEQTIPQLQFQGKFKFVKITLPNQTRADEFARGLSSSLSISWKLSRSQPTQPSGGEGASKSSSKRMRDEVMRGSLPPVSQQRLHPPHIPPIPTNIPPPLFPASNPGNPQPPSRFTNTVMGQGSIPINATMSPPMLPRPTDAFPLPPQPQPPFLGLHPWQALMTAAISSLLNSPPPHMVPPPILPQAPQSLQCRI